MSTLLSYALTSVADVKESLGIASADLSWDNLITRKINQATRSIENYCGRRFKEQAGLVEEYNATNATQLILKQRPITATTTFLFEVRNTALNTGTFETVDSSLYFVDNNSGVIDTLFYLRGEWNRYRVTYSAGYATIPEDLAEAASQLAAYWTINPDDASVGIQEKREGSRMVRYANVGINFYSLLQNLGIDQIVDSYANYPLILDR